MPYTLHPNYDYPFEAAMAITRLVGDKHPGKLREQLLANTFGAEKALDDCLGPVIALYDALIAQLDLSDERVPFLFAALPQTDYPLWALFLPPPAGLRDASGILHSFSRLLHQQEEATPFADAQALAVHIARTPLPLECKGKLLLALQQYEAFDTFLQPTLAKVEALLREKLPMSSAGLDATLKTLAAESPPACAASLGLPLTLREHTTYQLYPTFTASDGVFMQGDCIHWGINALPLHALAQRQNPFTQDRLHEVLRVLADKTKYDIIRMLRSETLYAAQLAERTGLSSATISHHISQLTSLWLVSAVKDGTRVYYELNRDLLDAYLQKIKASLLEA